MDFKASQGQYFMPVLEETKVFTEFENNRSILMLFSILLKRSLGLTLIFSKSLIHFNIIKSSDKNSFKSQKNVIDF